MRPLAIAALASAGLFIATSGGAQPPADATQSRHGNSCFYIRNADNFAATTTETVYVRVGVRQVWRLKLFATCLDLNWVHHMALSSRSSSWACEGSNPDLYVGVRATGLGRQRCPVTDIKKLTPEEVAALPKGDRP
jgi:hypothetical protein